MRFLQSRIRARLIVLQALSRYYNSQPYLINLHAKQILEILKRIDEAKRKMGRVMQIASFSLAEVTYAVGANIDLQVQESVRNAKFRIRTKQENVSGVFLPQFESFQKDEINDFGLTGLGKGGQQVQRCRETYTRAVETLVELASLQTAFVILDEVIKVVNRRGEHSFPLVMEVFCLTWDLVNAIEHVIIPRTENTIKCKWESLCYTDWDTYVQQISTQSSTKRIEKNSIGSRKSPTKNKGIRQKLIRRCCGNARRGTVPMETTNQRMCSVSTKTMMLFSSVMLLC